MPRLLHCFGQGKLPPPGEKHCLPDIEIAEQPDMPISRWIRAALAIGFTAGNLTAVTNSPASGANFIVRSWGTEDGLPQSAVITLTQTRDGYLWLGTLNGLVRFDGIRFTVFDEGNTPELGSSRIVHLFEDSRSNLWVGTETAGVKLIQDGRVKEVGIGRGSREGRLLSACEDSAGAVWLYTADAHLCRYRSGQLDVWMHEPQRLNSCRIVFPEGSTLWVGVNWGLFSMGPTAGLDPRELPWREFLPVKRLDFALPTRQGGYWRMAEGRVQHWQTNRLIRDFGPYPWKTGTQVSAACEDREGNLVVGTQSETGGEGIFWYDANGNPVHISSAQRLSHDGILSLCMDREGSLWVGTAGGGLNRIRRSAFEEVKKYQGWVIQSVCEDEQDGLWIGSNGGGLGYLKDGEVRQFGIDQGLTDLSVRSVFVDRNQKVWAGTYRGGLSLKTGELFQLAPLAPEFEIVNLEVSAIHQDRRNQLWFGTQAGLVQWDWQQPKRYDASKGLSATAVRALADDVEGNLWIGTDRGGLNCLSNGQFTAFRQKDGDLPSDNISSLLVDTEGVLWVGTGSGLARFHAGKWTHYTTRDGLAANSVSYLLEGDAGELWIGSNAGLMRVSKKNLNDFANRLTNSVACRVYVEADGLPTRECTQGSQPAACRARNGRLWFPTTRGLVSVLPLQLKPNPFPPPVVIESLLIDGKTQFKNALGAAIPQSMVVPPRREKLEIHYTSLNLASPQRARFKYWMENHEKDWSDASELRVAIYTKLPPGEYRFHVKACNEDEVWSETDSLLAITVEPPFWQTWWFRGASLACLLGLIIATVHVISTQKLQRQLAQFKQQEALEKERARIARDLHDQLGANLTQVSLLGELVEADKDAPGEIEAHAKQISQTARVTAQALDEIVWAANPANDTLDGLVNYACKYAQEYLALAGLSYRLDVPKQLPSTPIPPDVRHNLFLAFKESVNNVVKHARATVVWVRLRLEADRFTFEIEDNGCGVSEADQRKHRNGLRNMRKRMEDVGGAFSIEPAAECGTRVRLTAPLRKI